uniref:Uncharacterized protein n=1 Tax=Glossina palpalis gambiensis TaxID=67801 RepID=A0A1B0BLJ8_9MUSC
MDFSENYLPQIIVQIPQQDHLILLCVVICTWMMIVRIRLTYDISALTRTNGYRGEIPKLKAHSGNLPGRTSLTKCASKP